MKHTIWAESPAAGRHMGIVTAKESDGALKSNNTHIWYYQDVTQKTIGELVSLLRETELRNLARALTDGTPPAPVHLHIHSNGGGVFAGLAGMDAIRQCKVPVHTHIEGGAASAATFLSVAGTHRTIGRHGFVLIHQLSSLHWGKYEENQDSQKNDDLLMATIRKIYQERSNLTHKKVNEILKRDLWFDAEKALAMGLVDEIV